MIFVSDLLDYCLRLNGRQVVFKINKGNTIPVKPQFYVADNIFFFEVDKDYKEKTLDKDIVEILENEASNEPCWNSDIYFSPMEQIGNCEIRFPHNMQEVTQDNIFDNCYEIKNITEELNKIIIYLR